MRETTQVRAMAGQADARVDALALCDHCVVFAHGEQLVIVEHRRHQVRLLLAEFGDLRIQFGGVGRQRMNVVESDPKRNEQDDEDVEREQPPVRQLLIVFLDSVEDVLAKDRRGSFFSAHGVGELVE